MSFICGCVYKYILYQPKCNTESIFWMQSGLVNPVMAKCCC